MMAIIVKVAAGKRPGLELVRDDWPGECHQMLDLMKRCWDQDPKQRPSFAGGIEMWISQGSALWVDQQGISLCPAFPASSLRFDSLVPLCCHTSPSSLSPPSSWGSCLALGPCPAELQISLADIPVETDVLLALIQSLVLDPENERLVRKMSHKPAMSRSQQVRRTPQHHLGSSTEPSPCAYQI